MELSGQTTPNLLVPPKQLLDQHLALLKLWQLPMRQQPLLQHHAWLFSTANHNVLSVQLCLVPVQDVSAKTVMANPQLYLETMKVDRRRFFALLSRSACTAPA